MEILGMKFSISKIKVMSGSLNSRLDQLDSNFEKIQSGKNKKEIILKMGKI